MERSLRGSWVRLDDQAEQEVSWRHAWSREPAGAQDLLHSRPRLQGVGLN